MGFIRILLAISVLIFHSAPLFGFGMMNGIVAVKGFFVISGFYMALILNEKYKGANGSYMLFITNRLLRIYPIYWVILILTIIFGYYWAYHGAVSQTIIPVNFRPRGFFLYDTPLGILRDITLLIRGDYLNPLKFKLPIVAPAWTLIPELLFYLIAPFLVKRKWWVLLFIVFVSFLLRYFMYSFHIYSETQVTSFFPATIGYFLIGVLSFNLYKKQKKKNISVKTQISFMVLLSVYILFWDKIPIISIGSFLLKDWIFYPLLYLSLPYIFTFSKIRIINIFLANLSYPIYISHWFIFSLIWNIFSFRERTFSYVVLAIISTVIVSIFIEILISQPLEVFRQRRLKH